MVAVTSPSVTPVPICQEIELEHVLDPAAVIHGSGVAFKYEVAEAIGGSVARATLKLKIWKSPNNKKQTEISFENVLATAANN